MLAPHRSSTVDHQSHLKMRRNTLALFLLLLLTIASHGAWCAAAAKSAMAEEDAAHHHHLRPHHHGKRLLEIQTTRKVGHAAGGSAGGGSSGGGRSGGGTTDSRPHNSKNGGAMALPAPATSVLALVFTTAVLLSALSF